MSFEDELIGIYPWIFRIAKKYCKTSQDAEDLVGDTVYKMLVNRDKFDKTKSIKPWCLVVMRNTFITKYNRDSLLQLEEINPTVEQAPAYSASNIMLLDDIISTVKRCLKKSRSVECVMYYAEGYSYDEISELTKIPVGTVRSRISYGRKLLAKELEI